MKLVQRAFVAALAAATLTAPDARAQAAGDPPEWRAFVFLWGTSVDGDVTTRDPSDPSKEVRVSFDMDAGDVFSNLDAGFMVYGDARFAEWSAFGDYMYAKLSPSSRLDPSTGYDQADTELRTTIGEIAAARAIWKNPAARVELYGGARYYRADNEIVLRSGPDDTQSRSVDDWWDGIVGIRAAWMFAPRWIANGQIDGGWGGSEHSLSIWGYVGYQFDWGSVGAGWRYLNVTRDHAGVTQDLTYTGPLIGVVAKF